MLAYFLTKKNKRRTFALPAHSFSPHLHFNHNAAAGPAITPSVGVVAVLSVVGMLDPFQQQPSRVGIMPSSTTTASGTSTKDDATTSMSQSQEAPAPQPRASSAMYPYSTFTPPRMAPRFPTTPFNGNGPSAPRKAPSPPVFSTHHVVGVMLNGLLVAVIVLPMLLVSFVVYALPLDATASFNLIPGYNLSKLQLYATSIFVFVDLALFGLVYFVAKYSNAFFGCSTEMHYKAFCGTAYVPLILVIRLLQPLAIVSEEHVDLGLIWMIRTLSTILMLVAMFPLILSEIRLLRSIGIAPPIPDYAGYPFGQDPLLAHTGLKNNIDFGTDARVKQQLYDRRFPALIFFAFKVGFIFFFLLEISIINLGLLVPLSLDYPLILSVANLIFIYYSHKPIIAKYNIIDNRKTVVSAEFGCLDGRKCCNSFRPSRILVYAPTEKTYFQPATVEYTVYSAFELPKWLQKTLYKNKQIKMVSSVA
uniref:G_PROTEIN_RECEP_F1_2 domain-containing protein n=1 Tax=Panagrellus redivivus TaxID=6233 RepID=A0A7E4UPG7_PANRE